MNINLAILSISQVVARRMWVRNQLCIWQLPV